MDERRCQKCGVSTKGEEALVGGQIWCHPCADVADDLALAFMQFQARIRTSERQIAESDLYFRANRWEQHNDL